MALLRHGYARIYGRFNVNSTLLCFREDDRLNQAVLDTTRVKSPVSWKCQTSWTVSAKPPVVGSPLAMCGKGLLSAWCVSGLMTVVISHG